MSDAPPHFLAPAGEFEVDYRSHNGVVVLGEGDWSFKTKWGTAGNGSIYAYNDGGPKVGVAPGIAQLTEVSPEIFERTNFTSRTRHPHEGEIVLWLNSHGYLAATEIVRVRVTNESAPGTVLKARYRILTDKGRDFRSDPNAPPPLSSKEFRERLLVALYQSASKTNLSRLISPRDVAIEFRLRRQPGQLRLSVDTLERHGYVVTTKTMGGGDEGGLDLRLTGSGLEAAEALIEENPEYRYAVSAQVPAAGRYVVLTDNQRGDVKTDLDDLQRAVKSANEASDEDRQIALAEIAVFEAALVQPVVAQDLIDRFVNRVMKWIVTIFGAALLGEIAERLVERLLALLA